jgi:hypothetical protein
MVKTTLYLPDEMKKAVEMEAARQRTSEANVMRQAIAAQVGGAEPTKPRGGFMTGDWEPVDWNSDSWLAGFGQP